MGADDLGRWKDGLIVDRDDMLIDAAKRWLGPVKTPFNKHELVARLESFLRKAQTADAVVGLMDGFDRRVVALVLYSGLSVSDGIPAEDLVELIIDEHFGEAAAKRRIRSLRERLVLYAYREANGNEFIGVSPPLVHRLASELSPTDVLAHARETEAPEAPDPFSVFCAVISAGIHAKPSFKSKRDPSKKMLDQLEASAPSLTADKARFAAALDILEASGIFRLGDDGRLAVDPRRFVDLCDEAGSASLLAIASGTLIRGVVDARLAPGLLGAVAAAVPRGVAMAQADLRRIVAMAARHWLETKAAAGEPGSVAALESGLAKTSTRVADLLCDLGLVTLGDDGMVRATTAIDGLGTAHAVPKHSIVVEESHEIRILPDAGPSARAFIASIARLERTGIVWSAVLDKPAAKAAFAYGFESSAIAERLEAMSGSPLPQSVRFSLGAWESESRSARVRVGVVVALDGHLSGVLEHSPKAAGLVQERLADGVYMLAARDAADAERLLRSVGIDVDLRTDSEPMDDDAAVLTLWHAAGVSSAECKKAPPFAFRPLRGTLVTGEPPLVGRLLAALEAIALPADARSELEDKIRARLVLDEDQLRQPGAGVDGSVAGTLDYPAKLRLIEHALKDGGVLELSYIDGTGSPIKVVGVPREIRRTPEGTVVALSTESDSALVVAMSAIGKVRRLRNTTFGAYNDEHD